VTVSAAHAPLSIDTLRRGRAAARLGCRIEYFETLESTSTTATQLATEGAAEGTVVIAETQSKGRGRLGRTWASPPLRNLYLSIVLRPPIAVAEAAQLTLVAGLAAAEAVSEWVPQAVIKWPNDVLIDGRKVVGILTEMQANDDRVRCAIVGIGVNLNAAPEDFPDELRDKATSLSVVLGRFVDRTQFTDRLLSHLEERYGAFLTQGFAGIRRAWEERSCLTGHKVQIDGAQRCAGVVTGIDDDGALLVRDTTGGETRVVAGDVTLVNGYAVNG
jgi:BirA family transcriptional regulator, biotin operon repressor / biotin---[acetyl-CoA-carboxylase] ligase